MALPQKKEPDRWEQPKPGQVRGSAQPNADFDYLQDGNTAFGGIAANDNPAAETVDSIFARTAYTKNLQRPKGIGRIRNNQPANQTEFAEEDGSQPNQEPRQYPATSKTVARKLAMKLRGEVTNLPLRARATSVSLSVMSWQIPLWLFVQLPFAILGVIAFGTTYAIDQMASSNGGILGFLANKTLEAFNAITSLIGIDFSSIAADMMMLMLVIVLAIGMMSLLVMTLIYLMWGLKPLSGEGAGLKQGMFLLAIIGYSMPLLNMIPFVFLYMLAVWRYPR